MGSSLSTMMNGKTRQPAPQQAATPSAGKGGNKAQTAPAPEKTKAGKAASPPSAATHSETVEKPVYPLYLDHPESMKYTNLSSDARLVKDAYTHPSLQIDDGNANTGHNKALIHKVRPKDGSPDLNIIAIAGTDDMKDWGHNVQVWPRRNSLDMHVHRGFDDAAKELLPGIVQELDGEKHIPVRVAGHSLGGAMTTQIATRLKNLGYDVLNANTFGEPSSFGPRSGKKFEIPGTHLRTKEDPVANLVAGYPHVRGQEVITRDGELTDKASGLFGIRVADHSMSEYIARLDRHLEKHPEALPAAKPAQAASVEAPSKTATTA